MTEDELETEILRLGAEVAQLRRERDEARKWANWLAADNDSLLSRSRHSEIETLGSFRALPWAKEEGGRE